MENSSLLPDFFPNGDEYVRGKGDPSNILAYLQFQAERDIAEDCSLLNDGATSLLCRFYGYAKTPYRSKNMAQEIDLNLIREHRCGHKVHNLVAGWLYSRRGLSEALRDAVEISIQEFILKGGPQLWRPAV